MKNKYLIYSLFVLFLSFPHFAFAQSAEDIKGEAQIIQKSDNNYYLVNYDREFLIPADNSFELYSTSYVYLTVNADVTIKSINVAGMLHIQSADAQYTLTVGEGTNPDVAIKCGALEVREGVDLKVMAAKKGIESDSHIEITYGTHSISSAGSQPGSIAVSAGSFITLTNFANLYTYDESMSSGYFETGVAAMSDIIVKEGRLISFSTKYGIRCNGMLVELAGEVQGEVVDITTPDSYGILASSNIIVDDGTLSGSGNLYGMRSEKGIIRPENGATIHGTRYGMTGDFNAVHAENKIYAVSYGVVWETYVMGGTVITPSVFLSTYPLLENNMTSATNYNWTEEDGNVRATRTDINKLEKVKLDNQAPTHIIEIANASLN